MIFSTKLLTRSPFFLRQRVRIFWEACKLDFSGGKLLNFLFDVFPAVPAATDPARYWGLSFSDTPAHELGLSPKVFAFLQIVRDSFFESGGSGLERSYFPSLRLLL